VNFIQKNFKIRNCSDFTFKSRTRPCVEYQIKRCTAPCISSIINKQEYFKQIVLFEDFIKNDKKNFIKKQKIELNKAIENMNFEFAKSIQNSIDVANKISITKLQKYKDVDVIFYEIVNNKIYLIIRIVRSFIHLDTIKIKKELINKETKETIFEILSDLYKKISSPDFIFIEENKK
jgi:excinuclease ABC subunit C